MPDDAPVMRTIFPRIFSSKTAWNIRKKMLRSVSAGHKTNNIHNPTTGTTRLRKA